MSSPSKLFAIVAGAGPGTGPFLPFMPPPTPLPNITPSLLNHRPTHPISDTCTNPPPGRATALRFSKAYPVVLLARTPASYEGAVAEINSSSDAQGGQKRAVGVSGDAADRASLDAAFEAIAREFPPADGWRLAAAIYNVGGGLSRGPFLETDVAGLDASLAANAWVPPPPHPSCSLFLRLRLQVNK